VCQKHHGEHIGNRRGKKTEYNYERITFPNCTGSAYIVRKKVAATQSPSNVALLSKNPEAIVVSTKEEADVALQKTLRELVIALRHHCSDEDFEMAMMRTLSVPHSELLQQSIGVEGA